MAVIEGLIREESDGSLSFGDYSLQEKGKVDSFEANGDVYKVKTYKDLTRLEKNGSLLLEAVPGMAVHNLKVSEKRTSFSAEGVEDTQITMELEPEKEYKILIDGVNVGSMKTNLSGKINFSVALASEPQEVKIEKM